MESPLWSGMSRRGDFQVLVLLVKSVASLLAVKGLGFTGSCRGLQGSYRQSFTEVYDVLQDPTKFADIFAV